MKRLPSCLRSLCAVLIALAPVLSHAQTAMDAARQQFLKQVLIDSQLPTEQYIAALAARETTLAAAGDYAEAARFKARREQLSTIYTGSGGAAIQLPLRNARAGGSAQISADTLGSLRSSGSGAEWAQFRLTPGRYYFEAEVNMLPMPALSTRLPPADTVELEFAEVTGLSTTGSPNRFPISIRQSADETGFTTVRVGPLTFTHGTPTLRLTSTASYPANTIRVRSPRLVPVVDSAPAVAAVPAVPIDVDRALADARSMLIRDLAEVQVPVIDAYVSALSTLATSKPALRQETDSEIARLKKFTDLGFQKTRFSPPTAITLVFRGLDGFEDIESAQLTGTPRAGDRFSVEHDGKPTAVRLLWIACPPAEAGKPGLKSSAKHFSIDEEDALAVGRTAREFTAAYLKDKPLRLLVRATPDADGTRAALVFLPEVGFYQDVLIDHGYAACVPPPATVKLGPGEKSLLTALQAHESTTRKRKPPVGAWALHSEDKK